MHQKYLSIALITTALIGCASVPMGDPQQDAALKTFTAKQDVAGLYIYRNESLGAAKKLTLNVDGKYLGETGAHTYFYTELPPGKHTVTSIGENTDTLSFDAVAGKLYYLWQEIKMGMWGAQSKLHLVDAAEGQKGVQETKLAAPQTAK